MADGQWIPGYAPPDEGYWTALLSEAGADKKAVSLQAAEMNSLASDTGDFTKKEQDNWALAKQIMMQGDVLDLPVVGHNRGGVLVEWQGLRGFVPASHLVSISSTTDETRRLQDLRQLVGDQLDLKIIEIDPEQNRFVLSERATRLDEEHRRAFLDSLFPGDTCNGEVTTICSFGAFVDLGGVEGLVHVSELAWGRVEHPSDVVSPGDDVDVYVLNVDRDRGRVGLSRRRLLPDPWQQIDERYDVGQVVPAKITHLVNFGAFALVEPGVEGLIHVSEMGNGHISHPRELLQVGDRVTVQILNVDGEGKRMGLSLHVSGDSGVVSD